MSTSGPVVVMGVSGSGKSAVGAALAARLGFEFVDGDDLHPQANIDKMSAGVPLDDADRAPWLDAIGRVLAARSVVVACSALRRSYRDRLRSAAPELRLIYLSGDRAVVAGRVAARSHFMPASLLESQFATLEPPDPQEHPIVLDIADPVDELAARAATELEGTA